MYVYKNFLHLPLSYFFRSFPPCYHSSSSSPLLSLTSSTSSLKDLIGLLFALPKRLYSVIFAIHLLDTFRFSSMYVIAFDPRNCRFHINKHDGALTHYTLAAREYLVATFPGR